MPFIILSKIGGLSRFDDIKEIQKLNGTGLVSYSSIKHGENDKISHMLGRKRFRYWMFQEKGVAATHADRLK